MGFIACQVSKSNGRPTSSRGIPKNFQNVHSKPTFFCNPVNTYTAFFYMLIFHRWNSHCKWEGWCQGNLTWLPYLFLTWKRGKYISLKLCFRNCFSHRKQSRKTGRQSLKIGNGSDPLPSPWLAEEWNSEKIKCFHLIPWNIWLAIVRRGITGIVTSPMIVMSLPDSPQRREISLRLHTPVPSPSKGISIGERKGQWSWHSELFLLCGEPVAVLP